MNMSLKSVKGKIKSIDKTRQVTKAMEAVSAVKMRKSQEGALVARPYALAALTILQSISGSVDGSSHPLGKLRGEKKTCFIVVTSDRGLAGSLNSLIFKAWTRFMENAGLAKEDVGVIAIGRRGFEYFSRRGYTIIESYERWGDAIDLKTIDALAERAQKLFFEETYDAVWIIYTNFISTLRQEVYTRKVLPISFESVAEVVRGILPETGKFSERESAEKPQKVEVYTFEPDAEEVLAELMPLLLKIQLYHSVLEANASEHSARMMTMKKASDNARDLLKGLRLSYNKARQAAITREVSEIVGGTETLR